MIVSVSTKPIIMALALDEERRCERIVIGEEYQVRMRLQGGDGYTVLYDAERPLGQFLLNHERQLDEDWYAEAIYPLKKALISVLNRREYEASAEKFLVEKDQSHDPLSMFTAYQCRRLYAQNCTMLGSEKKRDLFEWQIMGLTRSFKQILWRDEKNYSANQVMKRMEFYTRINRIERNIRAQTWYSREQRKGTYLIIENSYFPAILYYLGHLRDWGICICKCCNCGRIFLAPSKHYSLCSEDCRKEKGRQNKREFDARARENKYDMDYKNASQRMRYQMKKLRKKGNVPEDKLAQIKTCFKLFRAEAVKRKKQIENDGDYKAFVDWLFEQEREFEKRREEIVCNGGNEKI